MDPLRRRARSDPEAVAVETSAGELSFAALNARADTLAGALARGGIRPGDLVATLLPPGPDAIASLFAAGRAGAAAAPLHAGRTMHELHAAVAVAPPRVVLVAPELRHAADALHLPLVQTGALAEVAPPDIFPSFEEAAFILWTSGTSGRPRAVRLSGAALLASARATRERLDLREEDRWLASLNLAHVGGLAMAVRAIVMGNRVILRERFDGKEVASLLEEGRATHASLVPTMLRRLLDAHGERDAPEAVRCLLIGGDHAPGDLLRRALARGWPLALTYGLTEASSQVCTAPPALVREKPGTAGPPLSGVEVRIAEDGEILVRGATMADAVLGEMGPLTDEEGWLHTGDAGRLDEDGHLWVTGRLSERIVSGGVNVDPTVVEETLRAFPGVREAAVVGVPDHEWGERVVAAIEWETDDVLVHRPLEASESPGRPHAARREALDAHCRERLSAPFRPRRFAEMRLPRNANGKVDRARVREAVRED